MKFRTFLKTLEVATFICKKSEVEFSMFAKCLHFLVVKISRCPWSNRKHTMALWQPLYGPCMTLEHSLQPAGISCMLVFAEGGEPGEKPSKQRRERTQTQPNYVLCNSN